jgi:hypothetical protein
VLNGSGFIGYSEDGINFKDQDNFWDVETSGQLLTRGNATGRTTEQMKDISTYTIVDGETLIEAWNIAENEEATSLHTWVIVSGVSYPSHRRLPGLVDIDTNILFNLWIIARMEDDVKKYKGSNVLNQDQVGGNVINGELVDYINLLQSPYTQKERL